MAVGAQILPDAASLFARAELIIKVKEPQTQELALLRPGQVLFTYLHLAPRITSYNVCYTKLLREKIKPNKLTIIWRKKMKVRPLNDRRNNFV